MRRSNDPVELAEMLANIVSVKVLDRERYYIRRIAGLAATSLLGADLMGCRLSELKKDASIDPWRNGPDIAPILKAPHVADFKPNGNAYI